MIVTDHWDSALENIELEVVGGEKERERGGEERLLKMERKRQQSRNERKNMRKRYGKREGEEKRYGSKIN